MAALNQAMSAYGRAADTMPALQQLVLLYDGAIARIREARTAIEQRRVQDRATAIGKAAAIVEALAACLDHERGGTVAANLDRLYGDLVFRLHGLALEPDPSICEVLANRLQELRDAWAELASRPAEGAAQGSPPTSKAPCAPTEPVRRVTA